jgi:hypothetical protein
VYSSAALFGLLTLLSVAVTSTLPATPAGATTAHVVVEVQLTAVALLGPNLKIVPAGPMPNPVPVMITAVAPAAGPELGLRAVTVGVNA